MDADQARDSLLVLLGLCNAFLRPVTGSLRSVSADLRGQGAERACRRLDSAAWQLDRMREAAGRHHAALQPPVESMEGTEPVAAALAKANVVSFNLRPVVRRFAAPRGPADGPRSWEALRQPVDYVVFVMGGESGGGSWLCRAVCDEAGVQLLGLRNSQPVPIPEGTRLRWLGRNLEVTLRSGALSYAVVYALDPDPPPPPVTRRELEAAFDPCVHPVWVLHRADRYQRHHGELPRLTS